MPDLSQDVFEIQNPLPPSTTTTTTTTPPVIRMSSLTTGGLNGTASQSTTPANSKNVNVDSAGGQASGTTPVTLSVPHEQELAHHNGAQIEAPYQGYKRELDHR